MFRPLRPLYVTGSVLGAKSELASSATVPIEVLFELAFDDFVDVRIRVAENPRTPAEILASMAFDRSILVRRAVGLAQMGKNT